MPKLVKDGVIETDQWTFVAEIESNAALSGKNLIIPANFWLDHLGELSDRDDLGVWLNGEDDIGELANHLGQLPLVAIHFPGFMDGRGFSTGRLLRERHGFSGELRATGNFIRDQLSYLSRCGFNAFSMSDDIDPTGAIESLNSFSEFYQSGADQPVPLFRRRA